MGLRDYYLALAVYDELRGVPVRKAVARGYVNLRAMPRHQQELFVRLGSLFFQGRSLVKLCGDDPLGYRGRLTPEDEEELQAFRALRPEIGAAVIRLLDEEEDLDPITRDTTLERLETMGILDDE